MDIKKKSITLFAVMALILSSVLVVHAVRVNLEIDDTVAAEVVNRNIMTLPELEAEVNEYLRQKIREDIKMKQKARLKEIVNKVEDEFVAGNVDELQRVYNCVFP